MITEPETLALVEDYHSDVSRDSNSSLSIFRDSVERYAAIRIYRTLIPPPPTPAMAFGSLVHSYILEPDVFMARHIVAPEVDRRTTVGKKRWAEFQLEAEGKTIVDQADLATVQAMLAGIRRNAWARSALDAVGEVEKVITWDGEIPLKMRADKITSDGLIIDLKTTTDISPDGFAKTVASYGYHRQAALYLEGGITQGIEGPFVFLAVSKEPPHECTCVVLNDDALRLGRDQNLSTMAELADRRIRGDWSGRWAGDIQTVALPRWAAY